MHIKKIIMLVLLLGISLFGDNLSQKEIDTYYKQASAKPNLNTIPSNVMKFIDKNSSVYILNSLMTTTPLIINEKNATLFNAVPSSYFIKFIKPKLDEQNITYHWVDAFNLGKSNILSKPTFLSAFMMWLKTNITSILTTGIFAVVLLYSSGLIFNNKSSIYKPSKIKGDFDDIIGQHEIKKELTTLIDMIKNHDHYEKYGVKTPTNIIFSGPPGTGKTKMAGYFAKSLNCSIIYASASNLESGFIGGGSSTLKKIASQANREKNAVIFLDEAQTLLTKRGKSKEKWADDTTNTLLTLLDGIKTTKDKAVIWILASNFDDSNLDLDEAVMRRFQKKINFRYPTKIERLELFEHFINKADKNCIDEIDYDELATITNNLSPAKIESIVKEAATNAAVNREKIDTELLIEAYERDIIGLVSKVKRNSFDKDTLYIATHELGHFFAHFHGVLKEVLQQEKMSLETFKNLDKQEQYKILYKVREETDIIKISIYGAQKSNGGSLGYALFKPDEEDVLTLTQFKNKIIDLYGGLAAESVIFGKEDVSLGASNDLERINEMTNKLYTLKLDKLELIEKNQKAFLQARYNESQEAIAFHKEELLEIRDKLIEKGILSIEEIVPLEAYSKLKEIITA